MTVFLRFSSDESSLRTLENRIHESLSHDKLFNTINIAFILQDLLDLLDIKRNFAAFIVKYTIYIFTRLRIVNNVAVADVIAVGCAVLPQRVLNKPREILRMRRVKASCIDLRRDTSQDIGATSGLVARRSISMRRIKPSKYARSM